MAEKNIYPRGMDNEKQLWIFINSLEKSKD